jgi:ABC-2 type transport system ATP-binding protein
VTSAPASAPVVALQGAGKRYTKYEDAPMLMTAVRFRSRTRRSKLWAVRGVDLQVERGECIGVIGRNGSGKSTLLQMLAGVTAPTEGRVTVRGRIAPLVQVGVGFHPELTGRENVYVNGTILGMTRQEIDERFDQIVEFSEIAAFVDTPVKFYSSGMFVRLGFAVAIHAQPDVLLVDEVLAVGDLAFQMKCFDRMMEIRRSGTTIVVVSHNLNAVRNMCDRVLLLHNGDVRYDGDPNDAISMYHDLLGEQRDLDARQVPGDDPKSVAGVATIESLALIGPDGEPTAHVSSHDEVIFRVVARFHEPVERPVFGFAVSSGGGILVHSSSTRFAPTGPAERGDLVRCDIAVPLPLNTGSYSVIAGLHQSSPDGFELDRLDETRPMAFYVSSEGALGGLADLRPQFEVTRVDASEGA